jgi:hypothetical protein
MCNSEIVFKKCKQLFEKYATIVNRLLQLIVIIYRHVFLDSNVVHCTNGIRVVELRYIPEGCVCHHWEFLHENPPTEFEVSIEDLHHLVIPENGAEMALVIEDDAGNVVKRRVTPNILLRQSASVS